MRAIILNETGGPEVLHLGAAPDPEPRAGEVRVRLHAAALNHRDAWIRRGLYAGIRLPVILGSDGAGVIEAVGAGVDESFLGWNAVINPSLDWGKNPRVQGPDFRILGLPDDGTYAEAVCVPVSQVHAMPSALSFEAAAALPLAGLTAYRAVVTRAQVQADETVLVTGAGGGVAAFAIQMARYCGAHVFVTTSTEEKLAHAAALGAEGGVNYRDPAWVERLRAMTDGGPDVVIDSAGGASFDAALDLVRPGGRVVVYGATTGPVPQMQLRRVFWKQLSVLGSTMGTDAEFVEMLKWVENGAIEPVLDRVYPLEEAAEAHRRMESAGQFGKIILSIGA